MAVKFNPLLGNTMLPVDQEPETTKLPWKSIISYKQTWGICLARFLTDPIWCFFLYWLPKFLNTNYHINLTSIGLPLIVIYLVSTGGSIFGGWLSSYLIRRGKNAVIARKQTILLIALLVVALLVSFRSSKNIITLEILNIHYENN